MNVKKAAFSMLSVGVVFCAAGLCRAESTAASSRSPFPPLITGQIAKADAKAKPANGCGTLQFDIDAEYGDNKGSASFLVSNGTQTNQVLGGEKRVPIGEGKTERLRYGFIVNVMPVCAANGMVSLQLQVELSAPSNSGDLVSGTWQYQSTFDVKKGSKTVVVSKPARIEITISDAKPE